MNTPKSGSLFVIVAPSGAGKSSLVAELLKQDANIQLSISYTTRAPRTGEVDGQHYHFIDVPAFRALRGRAVAAALAVPPVLSRLAMLERYYRDRSVGLPARWTPAEAHDNAVANLPATVRAVAASLLVDRLTVIDRDGGVLYDGADPDMFAGQWERGFHRPLSAVETADARMRLARIGSLRSVPGVGTALSDPVVASIRRSLDDLA